ncbi:MAG TPA: CoA-transferase [Bacillota bacterium]|nr:CoA-transferase [Bacillota bacterium]
MKASLDELMVFSAARLIKDYDVVMVGTGIPLVAAYLAKRTHAPNSVLVFESGALDPIPEYIAVGPGDYPLISSAVKATSLFDSLLLNQRGKIDLGFLGGAEIDMYGNINSTVMGDQKKPDVRLPGSGGANDIASCAKKVVLIAKHDKKKLPAKVSYLTSPGYLGGPGEREQTGLPGGGPAMLITNLGLFGFDEETKRMKVISLHPGVTPQVTAENTGFEILGLDADDIAETELPDETTLEILRKIDPDGIVLKK